MTSGVLLTHNCECGPEVAAQSYPRRWNKLYPLLKARRKATGLTQTVVAERLGKPPSFVAKYEGGDRRLDVLEFLDVAAANRIRPLSVTALADT